MITSRVLCYLVVGLLGFGLPTTLAAEDNTPTEAKPARDRLADVKAQLLDETPGFYVSPTLSASVFAGDFDVDDEEIDFDGYFVRGGRR